MRRAGVLRATKALGVQRTWVTVTSCRASASWSLPVQLICIVIRVPAASAKAVTVAAEYPGTPVDTRVTQLVVKARAAALVQVPVAGTV